MDKIQTLGIAVLLLGILTFPLYGILMLSEKISEIVSSVPLILRIGIFLLFSGLVIVMVSLIRERLIDWKKEKRK